MGLHLDPLENAMVLVVDEKSQIQALNRTQPGLQLKKGRTGTITHDFGCNDTTALLAALDFDQNKIIADCKPRHCHQEWLSSPKKIDAEAPADLDLHLILDNCVTHKHPKVKKSLALHLRFHVLFTPTSRSWLNMV